MSPGEVKPVIGEFFSIAYVQNTGVAFGLMSGGKWLVTAVQFVAIVLVGVLLFKSIEITKHSKILWAMIFAGGIGNLIDRVFLGYVTDMISFKIFPPVFNVADIFVTLGCAFLLLELIIEIRRDSKNKA